MHGLQKMRFLTSLEAGSLGETLSEWKESFPSMGVCALLPESLGDQVTVLQDECARRQVPLVGGIFPALVRNGEFLTDGVWLLRFDTMPFYALHADLPTDAEAAQRKVESMAQQITQQLGDQPDVTLFMLFDAMVPNISSILDDMYLQLANRVHYAGANAGSETFQPMACLFDGQRRLGQGVLLVLLPDHKGAILEHGYHAPQHTVYATSTVGNCISQIDWRPAFEVYQELVHNQSGMQITRHSKTEAIRRLRSCHSRL